jgi:hypothetical protein
LSLLLASLCLNSDAFSLSPQNNLQPSSKSLSSSITARQLFGGVAGGQQEKQGPKTVIDLQADTVKVGALRFFLQIFLVGEQNNPVKGAWVLNNNDENQSINMYYKDGSGMFSVALNESSIKVQRYGERPSMEYMLQESVLLHGVLDELNQIAFDVDGIEEEKRLLQFPQADVIDKARETLPARKA